MNTGTPYIGSKISLVSKAEIRYEGILYQVDTKEATVTLASVRSFGTENRPAQKPIPPRKETYQYIIFRGSDIKDLHVSADKEPEGKTEEAPQDPAILSAHSTPPPSHSAAGSQPPHPPVPPASYTSFPPNMPGYTPFGMPYFRPPVMMGAGSAPPHHPPHPHHPSQQPVPHGPPGPLPPPQVGPAHLQPTPLLPQPSSGATSASSTARPIMLAPPTTTVTTPTPAPASVEVKPQASSTPLIIPAEKPAETTPKAPFPSTESDSPLIPQLSKAEPPVSVGQPPSSSSSSAPSHPHTLTGATLPPTSQPSEEERANRAPREQRGSGASERRRPPQSRPNHGGAAPATARGGNRVYRGGRKDNYHRGPPRGAQNRPPSGSASSSSQRHTVSGGGPVYRYDSEFDFESANARFNKEDLEEEFKQKLKVEEGERRPSENGDPDVVVETEEGLPGDEEGEFPEEEVYDSSKSFFDNISCESNSGANRRQTRNEEREMNTVTFGVSSVRGYRGRRGGGYGRGRGRGYYRGRGGNRYYSGGGQRGGDYGGNQGNRGGYYGGRGRYRGQSKKPAALEETD